MRRKKYANLCICKGKRNPKQNMPADGSEAGPLHSEGVRTESVPFQRLPVLNGWKTRPTDDALSVLKSAQSVLVLVRERERQRERARETAQSWERAAAHGAYEWFFECFFLLALFFHLLVCSSYVLLLISAAATALHIVKGLKTCDLFRRRTLPLLPPSLLAF